MRLALLRWLAKRCGYYAIFTPDVDHYVAACRGIQEAGPPQRAYPWNEG